MVWFVRVSVVVGLQHFGESLYALIHAVSVGSRKGRGPFPFFGFCRFFRGIAGVGARSKIRRAAGKTLSLRLAVPRLYPSGETGLGGGSQYLIVI